MRQQLAPMRAVSFLAFQCIGSVVGGALILGVLGGECFEQSFSSAGFANPGVASGRRVLLDTILSGLLSLIYLWVVKRSRFMPSPIIIGFAYICSTMLAYPITGMGNFNPLRSLGLAVGGANQQPKWEPWVGALAGSALAATLDALLFSPRLWANLGDSAPEGVTNKKVQPTTMGTMAMD